MYQQLFEKSFEQCAQGLLRCDREGRIVAINAAACALLHCDQEDVLERPLASLLPAPQADSVSAYVAALRHGIVPSPWRQRVSCRGQTLVMSLAGFVADEVTVLAYLEAATAIDAEKDYLPPQLAVKVAAETIPTDIPHAALELPAASEYMVSTENVLVMHLDHAWRFTYANEAANAFAQTHLGLSADDTIGKMTLWQVLPRLNDPDNAFGRAYRYAMATKKAVYIEGPARHPTFVGQWRRTFAIPTETGLLIHGFNASEQKYAEQKLAQALHERDVMFNSIADKVLVLNRDWRFVYANQKALEAYPPKLIGKSYFEVFAPGSIFEQKYREVFTTNQPVRFEAQSSLDGCWLEMRVFPSGDNIIVYGADIGQLKAKEAALEKALAAKEMLVKEVHHRTKNNMQLISSMLSIQMHSLKDASSRRAIAESRDRINVLADVHKLMYQQLDSETISTDTHLRGLLQKLARSMSKREVTVDTDIAAIELTIHQAIPVGLIVNELFTNALKHAFAAPSPDDVIAVRLWLEQDHIVLEVADNGVGLPADFNTNQDTLGMTIIQSLVGQLAGIWTLTNGDQGGTVAQVRFSQENGQPED